MTPERAGRRRRRIVRRWHRRDVGPYRVSVYLGANDKRRWWRTTYGWRVESGALCLGPVYVTVWKRNKRNPERWGKAW